MRITERQEKILNTIVKEYIKLAEPISSQWLEKKYDFGVCPATIRNEMQILTEKGYLYQPHISAGRVPTDKGYRFFVNDLLENNLDNVGIEDWLKLEKEIDNEIKFIQELTKNLAHLSGTLVLNYLEKEKIFWKDGWEEILKEPEFEEKNYFISFTKFLEDFEKKIEE